MDDGCFKTNFPSGERTIPFSQVISLTVKDPKGALFPGRIILQLGGAPNSVFHVTSFFSVMNSNCLEFPHAINYLEEGRRIKAAFEEWQRRPAPQATPVAMAQKSAADEIRETKKLLDDGIITQEEFDAKKKQLLGL